MALSFIRNKQKGNPNVVKYWRKNPKAIEKFQFVYNFLPHPENKKRANLISNKAVVVYCLMIIIATATIRIAPKFFPGVLGYASNITIKDLLDYSNSRRSEAGVPNLILNLKLTEAAQQKAKDMFEKGYWAHVAPNGAEPWDFILGQKYDYIYAGENLAKNFSNSKEVVQAWYNSPSHKSNLLSANYDEVGFVVANGVLNGYETTIVVQMFGRPKEPSMLASVNDESTILERENSSSTIEPIKGTTSVLEKTVEKEVSTVPTAQTKPKIDVTVATKSLSLIFGGFVSSLLAGDLWYSKKKGINKFNGQTFAHLVILLVVIVSVWFVLRPGVII